VAVDQQARAQARGQVGGEREAVLGRVGDGEGAQAGEGRELQGEVCRG
jgi:hypothetical protein